MSDQGYVFGGSHAFSDLNPGSPAVNRAGMIWKPSAPSPGTYLPPTYFMPAVSWGLDNLKYGVDLLGGVSNAGFVHCATNLGSNTFAWEIYDGNSSSQNTTTLSALGSEEQVPGAILDATRSLILLKAYTPGSPWRLNLYDGGQTSEVVSLLPTNDSIVGTPGNDSIVGTPGNDINVLPSLKDNGQQRLWLAANYYTDGATHYPVRLEKRAGGTGAARWHNPPSMAEGAWKLNARGEAITPSKYDAQTQTAINSKIWRNGTYTDLNTLTSKLETVTITHAVDLASNGIILAQAEENGVNKIGLLVPVVIEEVATGCAADTLRSSNVAPSVELDALSLADVAVDAYAREAIVEVSGRVKDCFEDLTGVKEIDAIHCTTGQSFAVAEGSFLGTIRVPLGSGDVRVELETDANAAGRKGRVAFTLLTDYVPVPPPGIDPGITATQYDGFTAELGGALGMATADTLNVVVRGSQGLHFTEVLDESAANTVVADVFGKRLSLVEDAASSLRFSAQDAELGEVVLQFAAADFAGAGLPPSTGALISAQNVYGGASMVCRFVAYGIGHTAYQGYRILSLEETAANSLVFLFVTPDYGTVEFTLGAFSGNDPQITDTIDATLAWTVPVSGSSLGELVETGVDSGVFVPATVAASLSAAATAGSAQQGQGVGNSMLIVNGIESGGSFFGGTETIYRMRVPKLGNAAGPNHVTFTDPDSEATRQMALEEDGDTGWYRTKDFALLDIDPATAANSEQLLPGLSTQVVWTVQMGVNVSLKGESDKMVTRVQPAPTMTANYQWEEGQFFSGPFWVWGDDLVFDADDTGKRNLFKEGDADSEGIINVKLANTFDRITVEVFPAKIDQEGKPVPDGDALYKRNYNHPDKNGAGVHRFWDGRVNRIKDGVKAVSNYQPSEFKRPTGTVSKDKVEYHIESYDVASGKVMVRAKDSEKLIPTTLTNIETVAANVGKVQAWKAAVDAAKNAYDWEQESIRSSQAHPYFLDPDLGPCLVRVTGEYTEDKKKVSIVDDMRVEAHAKKYFVYLQSDQEFNTNAESPFQLASDVVSYRWAQLLETTLKDPKTQKEVPNSKAGQVKISRHTSIQQENTTQNTAVVALQKEGGWRFYDVFKLLTQRGELVIMSHGNTNYISLENELGGTFVPHEPGEAPTRVPYALPKLELNTATVGLLSCFSGHEVGGKSLGTRLLAILDAGPAGLKRHNRVDCFDDVCTAGHASYDIYFHREGDYRLSTWEPEARYRQKHGYYAATVDGWNREIAKSGNPAAPVEYKPVSSEMLTEAWTLRIEGSDGKPVSVKPGEEIKVNLYEGADDYYFTLPFPPVGQTQAAEIWEAPDKPKFGNPRGVKKADVTYSGVANKVGPTGVTGITAEIQPAEGNVLLLRVKMRKEDDTLFPRGGNILLARYALQKYEIEEGLLPNGTGAPGGDRLARLREIHAQIDIGGGKKASDYSTIRMMGIPQKYEYTDDPDNNPLDRNHIVLISPSP